MKKSASLQLSINAIVVLVMAMVVLGLGLGFVRGMFGASQKNLARVIDNNVLENQASFDTPFTLDKNVQVKVGKAEQIYMGIYNKGSEPATYGVTKVICNDQDLKTVAEYNIPGGEVAYVGTNQAISIVFPPSATVPASGAVGLQGSVLVKEKADTNAVGGTGSYICQLTVSPSSSGGAGAETYSGSIFITAIGG